ncbi:MAG TPA: hypothetical protein DHM90_01290, partial [Clostridiaceae bacterium]|nr:hypothetical protein [Clostridiaceae bacterium]
MYAKWVVGVLGHTDNDLALLRISCDRTLDVERENGVPAGGKHIHNLTADEKVLGNLRKQTDFCSIALKGIAFSEG